MTVGKCIVEKCIVVVGNVCIIVNVGNIAGIASGGMFEATMVIKPVTFEDIESNATTLTNARNRVTTFKLIHAKSNLQSRVHGCRSSENKTYPQVTDLFALSYLILVREE